MSEPQIATLARETRSSIEVTRNAKGDYQWSLKRYYEPGEEAKALADIKALDAQLRYDYLEES